MQDKPEFDDPITVEKLLKDIDSFCAFYDIRESTFGVMAVGDSALVGRLRKGSDIRVSRLGEVYDFMNTYNPDDTAGDREDDRELDAEELLG